MGDVKLKVYYVGRNELTGEHGDDCKKWKGHTVHLHEVMNTQNEAKRPTFDFTKEIKTRTK